MTISSNPSTPCASTTALRSFGASRAGTPFLRRRRRTQAPATKASARSSRAARRRRGQRTRRMARPDPGGPAAQYRTDPATSTVSRDVRLRRRACRRIRHCGLPPFFRGSGGPAKVEALVTEREGPLMNRRPAATALPAAQRPSFEAVEADDFSLGEVLSDGLRSWLSQLPSFAGVALIVHAPLLLITLLPPLPGPVPVAIFLVAELVVALMVKAALVKAVLDARRGLPAEFVELLQA